MDVISNNLANTNTYGYQQDAAVNFEYLHKSTKKKNDSFVRADLVYRDTKDVGLSFTHRKLDIALVGKGYFKILGRDGPKYTLSGQTFINNEGILINSKGLPFSDPDNQPIFIPLGTDQNSINIAEDGSIIVDKEVVGQVGVFEFTDDSLLKKIGHNLFTSKQQDFLSNQYTIVSGALKKSNVNPSKSMLEMIESEKSLQASSRLITMISSLEQSTVNKATKLNP